MAKITETPLMKQYYEMKKKHPDAILLFRVGDFYETFSDDAISASEILGITLTRRGNGSASGVELAGFPHHALDTYLPKLVRAGRRVAICEQLEDPKLTKKLVKRGITELVTPGLNLNDTSLPPRENNFLAALHFGKISRSSGMPESIGIAFLDLTTGEFLCAQGDAPTIDKLMAAINPRETLRMKGTRRISDKIISTRTIFNELDDWIYTSDAARERLYRHFSVDSLKGFGVDDLEEAVVAAGSIMHYLDLTMHTQTGHITSLSRIDDSQFMYLDKFTLRNLEILHPSFEGGKSLIDILDKTVTPMGSRLLRKWISMPLLDIAEIEKRQDAVEYFFRDPQIRESISEALRRIGDLYRLGGRLASARITPREMQQLALSLEAADFVGKTLEAAECKPLCEIAGNIGDSRAERDLIRRAITADPPAATAKGNYIADGYNEELDHLRHISRHSREALEEIRLRESEATGIPTLKISFNNVHGYYIEVRNTHKDKVPQHWIRRQTLVGAERYITPELKEYEDTILGAEEKIDSLEKDLYGKLIATLMQKINVIIATAISIAEVDCLLSMAACAEDYRYVRPKINDSLSLSITEGRHPVIERRMPPGESYISNSLRLDCDNRQIMMITGPNMSGKSALLRQTALIVLLAHTGSFVPAEAAEIGLVDKIMTRVGASDNISAGESTFMVEMNEASSILNNMSERSLILFDELGRGTSTYDGISIAWAIVEYIHENGRCRPKTLFATHYHELNEMEKTFPRISNYNVSVSEMDGKVVFMRKLRPGGSEHSFGIHVARLAGMPKSIVRRADQVLSRLEASASAPNPSKSSSGSGKSIGNGDVPATPAVNKADVSEIGKNRDGYQLSIFQLEDPLLGQIRDRLLTLNIDNLTPLQALTTLHDLQSLLTGKF